MNMTRPMIAAALCCSLFAVDAMGQRVRQPTSYRPARLSYNYYQQENAAPSPSDIAVVDEKEDAYVKDHEDYTKDDGKGHGKGCCCERCPDGPYRLFPEVGCGWQLTGFVAAGAAANADNPASNFNGPVTFDDRESGYLNQAYLSFGRDADTGGCGFAWGGRVDLLYGTDYIFTQAAGLETRPNFGPKWNGLTTSGAFPNLYGLAMPQAYAEVAYNNVSVKVGHFYTIIGYEVVAANGNFFYSHAYTMQYGEPFTHTGGLATVGLTDTLTAYGGIVDGWDVFDAVSDRPHFLGGASYTPCDERYTLTFALDVGDESGWVETAPGSNVAAWDGNRTMYSIVFDLSLTDKLNYVLQHDNAWQKNAGRTGADAEWYGINQYLFYTINDCWKIGARFEWFRDDDGVRLVNAPIRGGGSGAATSGAPAGVGGNPDAFAGNYYEATLGLNWSPTCNIKVRPEVRWDWSDGTVAAPYDDFSKDSQFMAAFDAIVEF